jgi:hypothetical protein
MKKGKFDKDLRQRERERFTFQLKLECINKGIIWLRVELADQAHDGASSPPLCKQGPSLTIGT